VTLAQIEMYGKMADEMYRLAETISREYILNFGKDKNTYSTKYTTMKNEFFQVSTLEIDSVFKKIEEEISEINETRIKNYFERYHRYWTAIQSNLKQISRYNLKNILEEVQRLSSEIDRIKVSEKNSNKLKQRIKKLFKKFFSKIELILGIPADNFEYFELYSSGYCHQVATEKSRVQLN
jgi:DNA repair ATPase RecN